MKPNRVPKKRAAFFIGLALFLFHAPLFGADLPSDKTIVLDELQIKGSGSGGEAAGQNEALPALSTSLPWEGEEEGGETNIAEEIFRQLAQPDPAYFTEGWSKEEASTKGD